MHVRRFAPGLILCCGLLISVPGTSMGETYVLKSGGRVVGKLVNPDQSPRRQFIVESVEGGRITLDASQVKQILQTRPEELEYEKVCRRYGDTPEDQWVIAEWCLQKRLLTRRKKHLERICELDPEHEAAHKALGHKLVDDQWLTRDEWMVKQGYVRFDGRYRSPQEIDMIKRRREREKATKEWFVKIKVWRGWLDTERDAEARKNLMAITDPYAVAVLTRKLKEESTSQVREMYADILGNIATPGAYEVLRPCAINDSSRRVRLKCLDHLADVKSPTLAKYYVGKLRDRDNRVVNRAATALGRMGDASSIRPLVDALTTTHKQKPPSSSGLGVLGAAFPKRSSQGPTAFSSGGGSANAKRPIRNQAVLNTLVALTGQNFGFDEKAWRGWLAVQQKDDVDINHRRD